MSRLTTVLTHVFRGTKSVPENFYAEHLRRFGGIQSRAGSTNQRISGPPNNGLNTRWRSASMDKVAVPRRLASY